ncbi:response regulator [Telmatobacter bradus]|uniref:response regulator n=1 Tax=Telmatobacter bradus TaxID=474953 RepID=UPI003B42A933
MTTETTQAPVESGPASDNGQGQSQGHRRRRRRRKNKSPNPVAQQAQTPQTAQAPSAPPPQAKPPVQPRKKKKVFQKAPPAQPQPGNGSAPQFRQRKPKQKTPREFVGPMDHSYRVVNGNVADGGGATIPLGGSRATHWEEPYVTPAPIRHDAPTRIYCFIEDLFFTAKIQDTAKKLGVKVEFAKGDKETVARLFELPVEERPALLVFDLNNANAKPLTLIPKFKTKFKRSVSMVGFLSHLQGDLKAKAAEAGCDTVMPRSAFSQGLPNMLRRYGVDEEEEDKQPM